MCVNSNFSNHRVSSFYVIIYYCFLFFQIMNKIHKACKNYESWKAKNKPQLKPWLYPEQITLPRLNLTDIQSMQEQLEAASADETNLQEDELDDEVDDIAAAAEAAAGSGGGENNHSNGK